MSRPSLGAPVNVLPVMLIVLTVAVERACSRNPLAPKAAPLLLKVLPLTVSEARLPAALSMKTLLCAEPETVVLVKAAVPVRLVTITPSSAESLPLLVMAQLISDRPATLDPRMPLSPLCLMFMKERLTLLVLVSDTAAGVLFWTVPPVPALPVPVTTRPPALPVLFSTMPFVPPPEETVVKRRFAAPMVVLLTLSAAFDGALSVPPPLLLTRMPAEPVNRPEPATAKAAPVPAKDESEPMA